MDQSQQSPHMPESALPTRLLRLLALASVGMLLILLTVSVFTTVRGTSFFAAARPEAAVASVAAVLPPDPYEATDLEAAAALVVDADSGEVWFSKHGTLQLPLASITKLLTAMVAADIFAADDLIAFAGELWPRDRLLQYMLLVSSNEAAAELARQAKQRYGVDFVARMQQKARQLGLQQSYFLNPSGLDESETQPGAAGSAHDAAKLLLAALAEIPQILEVTVYPERFFQEGELSIEARNTNKALGRIPGFVAGKTGYTDLAGGNLVIAFDAGLGRRFVAVVLGSSKEGRFRDITALVEATLQTLRGWEGQDSL